MHRIVVNVQTGDVTKVEYTAQEQAEYEAAKIVNEAAEQILQEEHGQPDTI